ncbi:MAG TPA: S9 family peptidase, partial [Afifellaceae bacterium]|nr:S9 family peptidase [Afifellaceae bacterium]
MMVTTASYGSWNSPIGSDLIASHSVRLVDVAVDGEIVYWTESRPAEQGRFAVVRQTPGNGVEDVLVPPFSARTLVHEYGGGALQVRDGIIYFSNFD